MSKRRVRVIRGGSYRVIRTLRASREGVVPRGGYRYYGFRVVTKNRNNRETQEKRMKNTELNNRLVELLSGGDEHWNQGMELARALGVTTAQVMNLLGLEMVLCKIPAGTGQLGENSDVNVDIDSFEMAETPTTRRQYAALMFAVSDGSNWEYVAPGTPIPKPDHPVTYVSAYDAEEYCRRLSDVLALDDGDAVHARLPLSAEWEYAAKAGQDFKYSGSDDPDEVAWHAGNSGYETHAVAQLKANAWGLHDMSGNVYEWCDDNWDDEDGPGAKHYKAHREAGLSREEWDRRSSERKNRGE